jgi:hypothetical protein
VDPAAPVDALEAVRHADHQARRNATAGISAAFVALVVWGAAEAARAMDFPEKRTKAVIALAVMGLACVQLSLGLFITVIVPRARDAATTAGLKRWHRMTGTTALLGAGFVTYLCMTGPFAGGPTLHRVVGFCIWAVVLVKLPLVLNASHRRLLALTLGSLLVTGFVIAFFTKGADVLW